MPHPKSYKNANKCSKLSTTIPTTNATRKKAREVFNGMMKKRKQMSAERPEVMSAGMIQSRETPRWWKQRSGPGGGGNGRSAFGAVLRPFKAAVSSQNTRFMEDGFDLDLKYVTKRIIVHGVPRANADQWYEDPRTEVRRLLDKYHFDRYKVYSFANELAHMTPSDDEQRRDPRVERYPFTDDVCPPLESVIDFCENAKAWLDADRMNVVSLHCKAGKGRAGLMAACLMVRMGQTAQDAIKMYDETLATDVRVRTGVNQRAWVFLYERLIREVWGLRDTIGTVSGQNPSLRAPPQLATSLRDVSLYLETMPRRSKWRQMLHHPSCAVYQQTPGGKALVHRAKMPCAYSKKEGQSASVFAASLPRSVVVKGTFQVVISAAAGLFGMGKNVLDVWCNTTFLGEREGQEIFTFSANDLPPGPMATRLLAARVCVVLTHTLPDAASPRRRHTLTDWEGLDAVNASQPSRSASDALALIGAVEHSLTPETDRDASDDPSGNRGALSAVHRDASDDDQRFYLSSNDSSVPLTPPSARSDSLRIVAVDRSVAPSWNLPSSSKFLQQHHSGQNTPARGGFDVPVPDTCPSPLRSCPRAAVSSRKEGLSDWAGAPNGATETAAREGSVVPRWASANTFNHPRQITHPSMDQQPGTPPSPSYSCSSALRRQDSSEGAHNKRARPIDGLERKESSASVASDAPGFLLRVCSPTSGDGTGGSGDGAQGGAPGGSGGGNSDGGSDNKGSNNDHTSRPGTRGERGQASRSAIRLDKLALMAKPSEGVTRDPRAIAIFVRHEGEKNDTEEVGTTAEDEISSNPETTTRTPKVADARQRQNRYPPPEVHRLLETAAMRSFDDLQSSRHSSVLGSITDVSDSAEGGARERGSMRSIGWGGSECGSFSDGDGEKATLAARVLAGWVDSGIRKPPLAEVAPIPGGLVERRLVATESGLGVKGNTTFVETDDLLTLIPPLSTRAWPPLPALPQQEQQRQQRVVAGEIDVQGILMPGADYDALSKHVREGVSWGEDAKLALARKRLQWEKSRRGANESSQSLRLHAALVAKREAELLAIETDVKKAVSLLEERIARRQSAEAALFQWRKQLPRKAYNDVISRLQANRSYDVY